MISENSLAVTQWIMLSLYQSQLIKICRCSSYVYYDFLSLPDGRGRRVEVVTKYEVLWWMASLSYVEVCFPLWMANWNPHPTPFLNRKLEKRLLSTRFRASRSFFVGLLVRQSVCPSVKTMSKFVKNRCYEYLRAEISETLRLGLGLDHFPGLGLENTHFLGHSPGVSLEYSWIRVSASVSLVETVSLRSRSHLLRLYLLSLGLEP